jgi:hypothetical protein
MSYDEAWKEAIDRYFPAFLEFFFPEMASQVDWSQGYEPLNTELQKIMPESEVGQRHSDVLVRITTLVGEETWIYLHIEVQSQVDKDFAERMYVYNYRIFDRYRKPLCSLAILGDTTDEWRPTLYQSSCWGWRVEMEFPIVKLLDLYPYWPELEKSSNPFGIIAAAHLHASKFGRDSDDRRESKLRLSKALYISGFSEEDRFQLTSLLDWLLSLSERNAELFTLEMEEFEEEIKMPYVTSYEKRGIRIGLEQGREQGREQGLEEGMERGREQALEKTVTSMRSVIIGILEKRFGDVPATLRERVAGISDLDGLSAMSLAVATESDVANIEKFLEIPPV